MHRLADELKEGGDMIREVFFKGVSTKGSDYQCEDGELQYADGVEHDGTGLKNQTYAELIGDLPVGAKLLYMHDLPGGGRNYILYKDYWLRWTDNVEKEGTQLHWAGTVYEVTSVGNVLCVMTSKGMVHAVWKDGAYTVLSGKLPELNVEMGLDGEFVVSSYDEPVYRTNVLYSDDYENILGSVTFSWKRGENRSEPKEEEMEFVASFGSFREYMLTMVKDGDFYLDIETLRLTWIYYDEEKTILSKAESVRSPNNTDWDKGMFLIPNLPNIISFRIFVKYKGKTERDYQGSTFTFELRERSDGAASASDVLADQDGVDSYTTVRSHVANFEKNNVTKKNKFSSPFLARCGLRMYDGSIVSLSAPCLLVPCAGVTPIVYSTGNFGLVKEMKDSSGKEYTLRGSKVYVGAVCCDLCIDLEGVASLLSNWRDLITDLVIAVTKPVDMYNHSDDKSVLKEGMRFTSYIASEGIGSAVVGTMAAESKTLDKVIKEKTSEPTFYITLPDIDDVNAEIEKSSNFYIVKEYSYEELGKYDGIVKVDIKGVSLDALAEREALPDGTAGLSEYYPTKTYAYNNRLHIANYKERIYGGYPVWSMNGATSMTNQYGSSETIVEVYENGSIYYVKSEAGGGKAKVRYYYYPNPNAKRVWVKTGDKVCSAALRRHAAMGGAYWFDSFGEMGDAASDMPEGEAEVMLEKPGYMRLSEANNPWVYRDVNTFSFDSDVLAVCSAVTALGTGQKGQFDLYIFTARSGVWSLKINDQGSYTRYVPVARDVICGDGKSLCQVDGSVLFASNRGVMELSGSVCRCISDDVNDDTYAELRGLPDLELLNNGETIDSDDVPSFRAYIQMASIIYDYRNQRLLVFTEVKDYYYIYSISGKKWSASKSRIDYAVNSYPDAYAVYRGALVNMSGNIYEGVLMNEGGAVIVTRAIKLGDANAMKRVTAVRLNGVNDGKMILYGSNDLEHWQVIGSANAVRLTVAAGGTAYRYFKLAANVSLDQGERLVSATFNVMTVDDNERLF